MPIKRKKTLNVFKDAREAWGSYDDFPVGPPGTDPMPHLSRNRCPQPFWLVSDADQVVIQMAGRGEIHFREIEPAQMTLEPGDVVYIPACVPSRLVVHGASAENVQLRLKPESGLREAVAWYCECGVMIRAIDITTEIAQEGYLSAVLEFNASERACPSCRRVHPPAELGDIAWAETAAALRR